MTDDERKAIEWLDEALNAAGPTKSDPLGQRSPFVLPSKNELRTLKAMLARPVMPEEPSTDALAAMQSAVRERPMYSDPTLPAYRALYAHLSKPKTKTVWIVTGGAGETNQGDGVELDAAVQLAFAKADLGYTVTLRKREVPA